MGTAVTAVAIRGEFIMRADKESEMDAQALADWKAGNVLHEKTYPIEELRALKKAIGGDWLASKNAPWRPNG